MCWCGLATAARSFIVLLIAAILHLTTCWSACQRMGLLSTHDFCALLC
jgi:hypothetical protein